MTTRDATIDGIPIPWEEHAEGVPVVLVRRPDEPGRTCGAT